MVIMLSTFQEISKIEDILFINIAYYIIFTKPSWKKTNIQGKYKKNVVLTYFPGREKQEESVFF